jgi:hypothetical protein
MRQPASTARQDIVANYKLVFNKLWNYPRSPRPFLMTPKIICLTE